MNMNIFSKSSHIRITSVEPCQVSSEGGEEVNVFCENLSTDIDVVVEVINPLRGSHSWQSVALIRDLSMEANRIRIITPEYRPQWDTENDHGDVDIDEYTKAHIKIFSYANHRFSNGVQILLVNTYSSKFSRQFAVNSRTVLRNIHEIRTELFMLQACRGGSSIKLSKEMDYAVRENQSSNFEQITDLIKTMTQAKESNGIEALNDVEHILSECFVTEYCQDTLMHYGVVNNCLGKLLKVAQTLPMHLIDLPARMANIRNQRHQTPLHYACIFNRPNYIDPLISMQAIIHTQDYRKNTPLHLAILLKSQKCIRKFIILFQQTKSRHKLKEQLKLLLQKYNYQGFTVLHLAVLQNEQKLVEEMLKFCKRQLCDPCEWEVLSYGDSLLHLAVIADLKDMAKLIIKQLPESVNCENYEGLTALEVSSNLKANILIQNLKRQLKF